jgi:hypothetical protein
MDHTAVVREKTTERYLLNELEPQVREEFEEHYFDCPECAQDVSAGSLFVEHSKLVLAESPEPASNTAPPWQPLKLPGVLCSMKIFSSHFYPTPKASTTTTSSSLWPGATPTRPSAGPTIAGLELSPRGWAYSRRVRATTPLLPPSIRAKSPDGPRARFFFIGWAKSSPISGR